MSLAFHVLVIGLVCLNYLFLHIIKNGDEVQIGLQASRKFLFCFSSPAG